MLNVLMEYMSSTTMTLTLISATLIILLLTTGLSVKTLTAPGPWGVPILGFYPFVRNDCHVHLSELAKKYGEAYLISMCGQRYLHLSTHKAVREAFIIKSDCFPGRSCDSSIVSELFGGGIVFESGESWKVQRKFWAQRLRDLTTAVKDKVDNPYFDSIRGTLKILRESHGEPVDINDLVISQCTKVFQHLTLGDNVSEDVIVKLRNAFMTLMAPADYFGMFLYGKLARYLMTWKFKDLKDAPRVRKEINKLYYAILNDHRITFNPDHLKDFFDLYLHEKKMKEEKADPQAKYFTDYSFISSLFTIYGDGDVTVGELISSYLKELTTRRDVQDTIYKEISDKIGTERFPTYEDRNGLPFTNSVIREIERVSTIFPFLPSLECSRDATIAGVYCPKGTIAITNFYAMNNDPSVYKNPEKFDPRRFLPNEQSNRPNETLPLTFGIGKRTCLGEVFVNAETFMFLTSILQHFILKPADTNQPKSDRTKSDPSQFLVIAIPRDGQ